MLGVDSCVSVFEISTHQEITLIRINPPRVKTYGSKKFLLALNERRFYMAMDDKMIKGWPLLISEEPHEKKYTDGIIDIKF